MKVTSPQVVWQAEVEAEIVRVVLKPGKELVFEVQDEDAAGGDRWTSLCDRFDLHHRFMLDLLGDVHEKQLEIVRLAEQCVVLDIQKATLGCDPPPD